MINFFEMDLSFDRDFLEKFQTRSFNRTGRLIETLETEQVSLETQSFYCKNLFHGTQIKECEHLLSPQQSSFAKQGPM